MLELSEEFNQYISQIAMDFTSQIHNSKKLVSIENNRQKDIKESLILLIKYCNDIPLNDNEQNKLSEHCLQFDYRTDIGRCICQVAYEENDKTMDIVRLLLKDILCYGGASHYYKYFNYLNVLEKYGNDLLHAMCYNHSVVLTDPNTGEKIFPQFDFCYECFEHKENLKKKNFKK